jgi:hypothetical protein
MRATHSRADFSCVGLEAWVRPRPSAAGERSIVNDAFGFGDGFLRAAAKAGRPSAPAERLLRAMLLRAF